MKTLSNGKESIQESLKKHEDLKWHLGMFVYLEKVFVSIREHKTCVDIRQYWNRPQLDESVPTKTVCVFDLRNSKML